MDHHPFDRVDEMRDPCTLDLTIDIAAAEKIHADNVDFVNHLIDTVRGHHERSICPVYCWGEHFRDDVGHILTIGNGASIGHIIYLLAAHAAGLELD